MNNGDFKQLIRTLRNWKNEGVQIKGDTTFIPKRGKSKESQIRQQKNDNIRKK